MNLSTLFKCVLFLIEIFNPAELDANIRQKTKKKVDLLFQTTSGSFQHVSQASSLFAAGGRVGPYSTVWSIQLFSLSLDSAFHVLFLTLYPLCELLGTLRCRAGTSVFCPAWAGGTWVGFCQSRAQKAVVRSVV